MPKIMCEKLFVHLIGSASIKAKETGHTECIQRLGLTGINTIERSDTGGKNHTSIEYINWYFTWTWTKDIDDIVSG